MKMGIFSGSEDTRAVIQEKKDTCRNVGQRMFTLFYILIAAIVVGVLQLIVKDNGVKMVFSVITLALNVAYGVVMIGMPDDEDRFRKAGIYYLISIAFRFVAEIGFLELFADLVVAVAGIIYVMAFVSAASDALLTVDDRRSLSWDALKLAYSIMYISLIAAILLALTRVLAELAALVILLAAVAVIVFQIWLMVLLYSSGTSLCRYGNEPIPDDVSGMVVKNGVPFRKKSDPNAGGWQCICGRYNPKYSHTCSCGKTKNDSDREKMAKRTALKNRTASGSAVASSGNGSAIPSGSRKNVELIKELKSLLDQGAITQEEYDAKKAELLRDIK